MLFLPSFMAKRVPLTRLNVHKVAKSGQKRLKTLKFTKFTKTVKTLAVGCGKTTVFIKEVSKTIEKW